MAFKRISVPQITINDVVLRIVPNTFVYDGGEAEISVVAASTGGGGVESVHSENVENAVSVCKFDIFLEQDTDADIATWKANVGANVIKAQERSSTGDSFVRTFPGMSLTARVERNASSDGVTSLEFMGDQMILG